MTIIQLPIIESRREVTPHRRPGEPRISRVFVCDVRPFIEFAKLLERETRYKSDSPDEAR